MKGEHFETRIAVSFLSSDTSLLDRNDITRILFLSKTPKKYQSSRADSGMTATFISRDKSSRSKRSSVDFVFLDKTQKK